MQKILPNIVHKHVDFSKRELCKEALAEDVQNAISYSEDELKSDYDVCYAWHDEYNSVPANCEKYEELFPEDNEIEGLDDLKYLFEEYPRPEPEYEHDDYFYERGNGDEILEIFKDL